MICTKILNACLSTITEAHLVGNQSGFMTGRSCGYNVFSICKIIEKIIEYNRRTHLTSVEFEKARQRVSRRKLWLIEARNRYAKPFALINLINAINKIYSRTNIKIESRDGRISKEVFSIED